MKRKHLHPAVKQRIRREYPAKRTKADKVAFAAELDMTIEQLRSHAHKLLGKEDGDLDRSQRSARHIDRQAGFSLTDDEPEQRIVCDPDTFKLTDFMAKTIERDFGRKTAEFIAVGLGISETAVLYSARKLKRNINGEPLPLRRLTKNWEARKVAAWLAMSVDDLRALKSEGVEIVPTFNRKGQQTHELVTTTSLLRYLTTPGNREVLLERGADKFFILELEETLQALLDGSESFELCAHLSAGHVCMNGYAQNSHGLFCSNNERYLAGDDPRCSVRNLTIYDLRPGIDDPDDV
jgi:hypothetical protein